MIVSAATVALAAAGCSGAEGEAPAPPDDPATTAGPAASTTTTAAAPSVSSLSGLDVCALLSPDEVAGILDVQGLAPQRIVDDKDGRVVAESCSWGSESEGMVSVSWMLEPIPAWGESAQSGALADAIGRRAVLNAWEGKACTVFAEGANGNIGINIVPSESYLTTRPSSAGDDICDRNQPAMVSVFERAQPA